MDQQFSLSWNNFHGNLSKGFAGLLGNGEFVDVTIAVEGHLLQAHKVILSICSPYFKKMFQLNPCQHPIVVLRDVSHKAMRDLLQFMYHGEVSVKREDLTSFIGTAEVLQIKGLTNKETEEECCETEKEPHQNLETQNDNPNTESCASEMYDTSPNETQETNDVDILKQRQFIEKLQQISTLKRKSEEFLKKNFYTDVLNAEKRQKFNEKFNYSKQSNHSVHNAYENLKKIYDENPVDITTSLNPIQSPSKNSNENNMSQTGPDTPIELKTECDDSDIIVTDPAVCTTHDAQSEGKKSLMMPLDLQTTQDNCSGLSTLFLDLKNLVNGKIANKAMRTSNEEYARPALDHRLVTIPQKEDGKKKYPQRSCRLCWRIGKRRDTRFMCSACELPFCKSPCFEVHFNDVFKVSHLQGDYYAN
ncbi:kelch repeat and BTB domain-containing protein 4-like isoform X1 [Zerene cesonia]|uniref:kelch repeat and BTB domain-containing protein 4-like isoform X1 n=1 Tax=Zerene cesonia TaxID=33412 RepID=UPI0018E5979A|nr:kelch repeat and BTB domain-containing protein 4-like isoform X1 [Zerene cesonia]